MFAPTPSLQGSGDQSNQERKEERCPHCYSGPVVGGEKDEWNLKEVGEMFEILELMKLSQE